MTITAEQVSKLEELGFVKTSGNEDDETLFYELNLFSKKIKGFMVPFVRDCTVAVYEDDEKMKTMVIWRDKNFQENETEVNRILAELRKVGLE